MAKKFQKIGIKREQGYLYFIDKQGDVAKVKMARGGVKPEKQTKVKKLGIKRESGYLYFIDSDGDISRATMKSGGGKKGK
jgi:hypothetical protein